MNGNSVVLRTRSRATGALVVLIGIVLAMFSAVWSAPAANASEVDGVTSVDIVNQPPYVKDAQYQVNATWAVPDDAQPGDTFTLNFPDALVGFAATIDLPDADGNIVGTCQVTESQFVCTLSDFVATHDNVHGTLTFNAKFIESFTEEQVDFTTGNNVTITADVEGGVGTTGSDPAPAAPTKFGYPNNDGESLTWVIRVPGDDLGGATNPVITDDYDAPLVFDADRITVRSIATADWAQNGTTSAWTYLGQGTGVGSYTLTDRPADTAFDVRLNGAVTDGSRIYEIIVEMDFPAGAVTGDVYNNSAVVDNITYTATPVPFVAAGGDGQGDDLGDFTITKTVIGTGAQSVAGATYTVEYSYVEDGQTVSGAFDIAAGESDGLDGLVEGTVVTLEEVTPVPVSGAVYGTPVFSGAGVTDNLDGTATVVITDGVVAVGLANPVSVVPPTEQPTPSPTPTTTAQSTPTTPAAPTSPARASDASSKTSSLAITGADPLPLLVIAGVLVVLGVVALMARRRAA